MGEYGHIRRAIAPLTLALAPTLSAAFDARTQNQIDGVRNFPFGSPR